MNESATPLRSPSQRAVAAAVTSEITRQAADLWSGELTGAEPVRAVQNYVFTVARVEGPAILRLTHESHRQVVEVEAELRWVLALKERGLPVAAPYRSRHERLTETVPSGHGQFVVSCFEHLSGIELDPNNPALWTDRMFEQLGALTAQLHQASYDAAWTQATLPRRTWREESVAQNFHFYVPVGQRAVHEAFDRVLAQLDALPRPRDAYGLIHADLNHTNFFLTPVGLNLFDFDDSCYCWFAYDLIVPIFHFPTADPPVMNAQAQHAFSLLRRGYESVRRFNPAWLKWLPLLFRWRDLLTYGFFYEQLEIPALPENLRQTFLGMRNRIEAGRPIAEIGDAG
ncbi:MAG: phosphotransferase [Chthoniobacterales bacterium]